MGAHRVNKPRHILLAGLRGSGKTTLGRLLAERLGMTHIDLDERTTAALGRDTCASALAELGEPAFREGEARALERVLTETPCVVSLGGGSPTAPGARALINESGALVFYLRLTPAELAQRLSLTDLADRPSLTGAGVIEEIQSIYDARDPLYVTLGETLDVGGETVEQTLERLADRARA